jgi:hypothetical protein
VGVSLSGGDFVGAVISPVATLCLQVAGISFEGDMMGFLNLMAQVDKGQRHEIPDSTPKLKGRRELKNLECSINFDDRNHGSCQSKSKKDLVVM